MIVRQFMDHKEQVQVFVEQTVNSVSYTHLTLPTTPYV